MKINVKKASASLLVAGIIGIGTSTVSAASFGNSVSGASTVESFQIKYNGAAWNYKNSPYKSTSFRYKRANRTLLTKTAYSGKVTGSVWDDVRWGEKYKTIFSWWRGSRK